MVGPESNTTTIDMAHLLDRLASTTPQLLRVFLFGSRRFQTGSIASDIDLLAILKEEKVLYSLSTTARKIMPYFDVFQVTGGHAVSLANGSQVRAKNRSALINMLDAVEVWCRDKGWTGPASFRLQTVLVDYAPPPSALVMEGHSDPALSAHTIILTALQEEFAALFKRFSASIKVKTANTPFPHAACTLRRKDKNGRDIIICQAHRMGNVASALVAFRALERWKPSLVILTGITGGIRGEVNLGDIIVPDRIIEYEATKVTADGELSHGLIVEPNPELRRRIDLWPEREEWLSKISNWTPTKVRPAKRPRFRTDAMASGEKVIAYAERAQFIQTFGRKTIAIEMESIGVAQACALRLPSVPFVVIKSVSDFANEKKCNKWHPFCVRACSDLLFRLLQDCIL